MAKADRIVSFILPGPLLSLDTRSERHDRGGTIRGRGGPGMAVLFGPGETIYSTTDGPEGPILRGGHPRRDRTMAKLGYLATGDRLITIYYTEILHSRMYAHLFLTTLNSNYAAKTPMYTLKSVHWYPCITEVIRAHTNIYTVVVHVESA